MVRLWRIGQRTHRTHRQDVPLERYVDLLVRYLVPQWRRVLLVAVLLPCSIGLQLASPLVVRFFIDSALAGAALGTLTAAAVLFVAIALVQQAVTVADVYLGEYLGWTATNALRADLTHHCLRLGPRFHQAHAPGELIERIDGDTTALANFFARFLVVIAGNTLLLLGMLAVLSRIDWRVGLTFAVFTAAALALLGGLRRLGGRVWAVRNQAIADFYSVVEEQIVALEDVQGSGAGAYVLHRQDDLARESYRSAFFPNLLSGSTWSATIVLFALATAIAFALGARFAAAGTMTIGTVYLIFSYAELLRRPVEQLTQQLQDLHQASGSIERIRELLDTPVDVPDGAGGPATALSCLGGHHRGVEMRHLPARRGTRDAFSEQLPMDAPLVEFEDVTFTYSALHGHGRHHEGAGKSAADDSAEQRPALAHVSFRLEPAQVLGVVGRIVQPEDDASAAPLPAVRSDRRHDPARWP